MKTAAIRLLEQLGLPYELRTFEAEELTAREAAVKLGLPPERVFKTLVVRGERRGVMLACIAGSATLDLRALARVSGDKRVELVPVEEIHRLTGYIRGGVSPLGTRRPYPLYLDERAFAFETISVSAGMRGLQMLIAPKALKWAGNAIVAPIALDEGA